MALWSAALFGHYKPRWYLRDRASGMIVSTHVEAPPAVWNPQMLFLHPCEGWERRAELGDIIAVRPFDHHDKWTPTERKEFLIVVLDDFEAGQVGGMVEPQWDTDSYPVVSAEKLKKIKDSREIVELTPLLHVKKRRFHLTLDDLRDHGVDIDKMLNKDMPYNPDLVPITKVKCYDKLNKRYARKADGFNLLPPKRIGKVA